MGKSQRLDEVIEILRACDELSAIEEAIPEQLHSTIDEMLARLRALLS